MPYTGRWKPEECRALEELGSVLSASQAESVSSVKGISCDGEEVLGSADEVKEWGLWDDFHALRWGPLRVLCADVGDWDGRVEYVLEDLEQELHWEGFEGWTHCCLWGCQLSVVVSS